MPTAGQRPTERADSADWIGLMREPLRIAAAYEHCVDAACGAVVLFSGTVRDHAGDRTDVSHIDYEAYEEQVEPKLAQIAQHMRTRWNSLGQVVLLHRVGPVALGESSVVVAASSPHRADAFAAARFGIDTIKATLPIWKCEHHAAGTDWGLAATDVESVTKHVTAAATRAS